MAILAALFGVLGRFVGKLLTAALGWASTLLFGRVPQDKQILLVLITFGSIAWVAMVLGILVPNVGTFLLTAMPVPSFVDQTWIRLAMLAGALVTPLLIGVATVFIQSKAARPAGPSWRDRFCGATRWRSSSPSPLSSSRPSELSARSRASPGAGPTPTCRSSSGKADMPSWWPTSKRRWTKPDWPSTGARHRQ